MANRRRSGRTRSLSRRHSRGEKNKQEIYTTFGILPRGATPLGENNWPHNHAVSLFSLFRFVVVLHVWWFICLDFALGGVGLL